MLSTFSVPNQMRGLGSAATRSPSRLAWFYDGNNINVGKINPGSG
jgi:hypothetical protein